MCRVSPEMVEPDFVIELATITPMYEGSGPPGGDALLLGPVVQLVPHTGGTALSSNPLNDDGVGPPLRVLSFDHWAPQNVTAVPLALLPSPITKPPPGGKA